MKADNGTVLLVWNKMVPVSQAQDPLGLTLRVSARLSSELLHCITSITPRARYFSFLPWCVLDFWRREKASRGDADLIEAVRLREKALTLACVLHHNGDPCNDGRLVGSEKAMEWVALHANKTPALSQLSFVKNPALYAYYNSLVHLGFFKETTSTESGTDDDEPGDDSQIGLSDLELSELGARVSLAYESAIGKLPVVAKLTQEPDACKPAELKKWGEFGGICELTSAASPDRGLLREVFFNRVGSPGPSHRFRHDSLVLLMEVIDKIKPHSIPMNHHVLGDAVYFGATMAEDENGAVGIHLSAPLSDIANRWRMFYFHYYLSVALESLFVGVVGYAQRAGMAGTRLEFIVDSLKSKGVVKHLTGLLGNKIEGNFLEITVSQILQKCGFPPTIESFQREDGFDAHFNCEHPFAERNLEREVREGGMAHSSPEGIACALLLLMMTVCRYMRWEGGQYGNWLAGSARDPYRDITAPVVLRELRDTFGCFWGASWREIATVIIGRFVIGQHEVLSYEKVWDGSRALFHSERGVIRPRGLSYDNIVVENSRFNSAIQILKDLALVEHEENDHWHVKLTADGKTFLRAELGRMAHK